MCVVEMYVFSSDSAHEILVTVVMSFPELGGHAIFLITMSAHDKLDKLF